MEKLTALRVFRRVVERRSFSRAAQDLRLSNAAVSKNVRELEAELGAPLILRTTRRLSLTALGEMYYERASAILDDLTDADRAVKEQNTGPRGSLRIATPMSFGLTKVMPALDALLLRYPELKLHVEMSDRHVDLVREGFDLCIRGSGALADSTLVAKKLTTIERVVVASPSYLAREGEPRTPSQLRAHRCLVYALAKTPERWTLVRGAKKEPVAIAGSLHVNSSLGIVQAASAGVGIGLVPVATAQRELADGRLTRILPEWKGEPQALFVIHPRHRETTQTIRLVIEHLVAVFA